MKRKERSRKARLPQVVAAGFEIMAEIASKRSRATSFRLREKLPEGRVLVAVAEGDTLAVRTVEGRPSQEVRAGRISRRLAEMDVIASEIAEARPAPPSGASLTAAEEKALEAGGFDLTALPRNALDPVALAAAEYARLLQDSLSVEEAAALLRVNGSRIRQRLAGTPRTLYGIKKGREWRLPLFQFMERSLVPGFERVAEKLDPQLHPVSVWRWLTTSNADLPFDPTEERRLSPLEWLKLGNTPEVAADLAANL